MPALTFTDERGESSQHYSFFNYTQDLFIPET